MLINPETIPKNKRISVNGVVANYLMNEKKIPLLGKSQDGKEFFFIDTYEIQMFLQAMPFWYKLKWWV